MHEQCTSKYFAGLHTYGTTIHYLLGGGLASVKLRFLVVPLRGLSVPQKHFGALQGASGVYWVGNSRVTLMLGTTGDIVPLK